LDSKDYNFREQIKQTKECIEKLKQSLASEGMSEKRLNTIHKEGAKALKDLQDISKLIKKAGETIKGKEIMQELPDAIQDLTEGFNTLLELIKELYKARKKYIYPVGPGYMEDTLTMARKEPLKTKHYKGGITREGKQLEQWETPEGLYIQELIDTLPGLNAPVVTGDFVRHMLSIHIMLWRHNKRREKAGGPLITEIEFNLKQYQLQRGRTEEEIRAGGSFTTKARQLIMTGAMTTFIKREQDNPGGLEIGHFYRLRGTPGKRRGTFILSLQEPYREDFLRAYEVTKRSKYIPVYEGIINDRSTEGKKDYLMFFVFAVLRQLNTTGQTKEGDFIQMQTLLEKARVGVNILQEKGRDKEAWRCFIEGLQYYNKMTEGLSSIVIRGKAGQEIMINDFAILEAWTYETFTKDILQPLGLEYCKDLKVAFMGMLPAIKEPEAETSKKLPADQIL